MSFANTLQVADIISVIAAIASLLAASYSVYSVYEKRRAERVYLSHLLKMYRSTDLGMTQITQHRVGLEKVRANQYEFNAILIAQVFDLFNKTLQELPKRQRSIIVPALKQPTRKGRVNYMLKLLDALEEMKMA